MKEESKETLESLIFTKEPTPLIDTNFGSVEPLVSHE